MSNSTIAIIDQGIDVSYKNLRKVDVEEIIVAETTKQTDRQESNLTAHGTNILNIISTNTSKYRLMSVRLYPKEKLSPNLLCRALDVCAEQPALRIINISLGFFARQYPQALLKALQKCHDRGIVIVAATHPSPHAECYPAKASFVFGVGAAMTSMIDAFQYLGDGYINVLAKGVHQRLSNGNGEYLIRGGTSYATATFTAIVANIIQSNRVTTHSELIELLKEQSVPLRPAQFLGHAFHKPFRKCSSLLHSTHRVLLFATDDPETRACYREIAHAVTLIVRYPINPANCFDMPVNAKVREIDGILSPRISEYADTLVVGNFLLNPHLINIYFAYALIDLCVKLNFNFVCLDSYIRQIVILAIRNVKGKYQGSVL